MISSISFHNEPTPKAPTVNAIAPNAPIGATRTTMPMIVKNNSPRTSTLLCSSPAAPPPRRGCPEACRRKSGQDRDQQHRQQGAARERCEERVRRDDGEQVGDDALFLG